MKKIIFYIEKNDFEKCINIFEEIENDELKVKELINYSIEEYSIYILNILFFLCNKRNSSFWYNMTGFTLSFYLSHLDGSERTALLMFKKSFELNPKDITTLIAILDFHNPPEIVLSDDEYNYYSNILLNEF